MGELRPASRNDKYKKNNIQRDIQRDILGIHHVTAIASESSVCAAYTTWMLHSAHVI